MHVHIPSFRSLVSSLASYPPEAFFLLPFSASIATRRFLFFPLFFPARYPKEQHERFPFTADPYPEDTEKKQKNTQATGGMVFFADA
jgi:hypothetical protein